MAIAITLKEYLRNQDVDFEVIEHRHTDSTLQSCEAAHVPGDRMAKSVLLGDDGSYLMAVIPASHRLQLKRLNELTGRHLEMIREAELVEAFADCEPGAIPPTGRPYGIETIVDQSLTTQPDVYFETGDHTKLIHVSGRQFCELEADAREDRISTHL